MTGVHRDDLLLAWSGDLFLHGHHLSRWMVDYVDLEESLAIGSLAQEHLGHARELLTLSGLSTNDIDAWLFDRPLAGWTPSELAATGYREFPATVASALLLATATDTVIAALARGDEAARQIAELIGAEQRLHVLHWSRWVGVLHRDPNTHDAVHRALDDAAAASADLFGLPPDAGTGEWDLDDLHAAWSATVAELVTGAGCPVPAVPAPRPRRPGAHAALLRPVLDDLTEVRSRFR